MYDQKGQSVIVIFMNYTGDVHTMIPTIKYPLYKDVLILVIFLIKENAFFILVETPRFLSVVTFISHPLIYYCFLTTFFEIDILSSLYVMSLIHS